MTRKEDLELVIDELEKISDKYRTKETKAISKAKEVCIVFKGEEYRTETDVMDAYGCDVITSAQADKLLEKLEARRTAKVESKWTGVIHLLDGCVSSFKEELYQMEQQKLKQEYRNDLIKEMMEYQHLSYNDACKKIEEIEEVTRQSEDYERLMGL